MQKSRNLFFGQLTRAVFHIILYHIVLFIAGWMNFVPFAELLFPSILFLPFKSLALSFYVFYVNVLDTLFLLLSTSCQCLTGVLN